MSEVLIAITRPDGYEDAHASLLAEDAVKDGFQWRIVEDSPNSHIGGLRDALISARHYVVDAIEADGGIDSCEYQHRATLEKIDAALSTNEAAE